MVFHSLTLSREAGHSCIRHYPPKYSSASAKPLLVGFIHGNHGIWTNTTCPKISQPSGKSALLWNAPIWIPSLAVSKTRNLRSANVCSARSAKTIKSTGSVTAGGKLTPRASCSAIMTTGSSHNATTLLPGNATVPSCGPSGSLKSYVHWPGSAASSDVTASKSCLVNPGYAPAIYDSDDWKVDEWVLFLAKNTIIPILPLHNTPEQF